MEKGGGVLLRKQISSHKDHLIRLVTEGEQIISGQHDFFDANYVINCSARRSLLPDLTSYRVNRVSVYQAYNPVDVLTGKRKWDEILKADCGEKVSDIEDDVSEENMTLGKRKVKLKGGRMPYCRREREEIVEWIVKNGVFKDLRGNRVWARMELEMGGRSQQSLKEHFRKVIMPQIHTFKLSEENLDNFRVGMGLKQDDMVGARIALMSKESPRKKKKSKVDSPKKKLDNALKNLAVDESAESFVEPSLDDVQTTSQTSVSVSSLQNIQRSPKPFEERSPLKKCFGPHARARIDLDTLLEQSDIDLSDKDSTATEPFNEDGVAAAESLAPERKKVKLFRVSEQFMTTPADPDTPAFGQRRPRGGRKRNLNIAGPPASSLQFNEGLREAGRGLAEDTEEDSAGLTSTQNLVVDEVIDRDAIFDTDGEEDVENEVFVNTSPTRKSLSPRKESEDPAEKLTSEVRVNVKNHRLSDEEIVECQEVIMRPRAASSPRKHPLDTEDQPVPSGIQRKFSVAGPSSSMHQIKDHERLLADSSAALLQPEESDSGSDISKGNRTEHLEEVGNRMGILEEMMRKSQENSKKNKSGVKIKPKDNKSKYRENQSQNLLERHLNDHEKYNAKGGPETQDIVDALNNVDNDCNKEEDNDDEISFRTLSNVSPVRRKRTHKKTEQHQDDKWETSTYKSGRFFNEGEWGSTFRIPFSRAEEKAIINFFLEEGGFQWRKGVSVWKRMEAKKVCHLRTWQAMKARWENFIFKKLATYDVTEERLVEADMRIYGTTKDGQVGQPANQEEDVQSMRGRNGRTPYSREEDTKIINHLLVNRRYLDVKGKEMWWVSIINHYAY